MTQFSIFRKAVTGFICLCVCVIFLAADEKTDKVDKLFAQWDTTVTPGAALAIVKDGQIIYKRGYGMAKLEDNVVMTPSKIFDIGSVSKQFTATCIAFLVRAGKISLDDDIHKYIPEMPNYEKPITIRHLIHHTSGIRDYNALLSLAGFRPDSDCPAVEEAIKVICSQKKLNYAPGEEYSYTNSGYFLLAVIVERVSGKSLNAFAQEYIFRPLGMHNTLFQDDHTQIIKNRATGYSPAGAGFKLDMSNWDEVGDGNVYTSVEDLYLWDQAFYTNELGKDIMDMLQSVGTLNSGKKLDYAFGLIVSEYKGLRTVSHGGSWAGFRAGIVRFPEQNFSVICLANLANINPSGLCLQVADIYLSGLFREAAKTAPQKPEPIVLSLEELKTREGNYQDEKFGTWISLSVKDNKLRMAIRGQEILLSPVSKTRFQTLGGRVEISLDFTPQEKSKAQKVTLIQGSGEGLNFVKAAPLNPLSAAQLNEYAGEYTSAELLQASYGLSVDNGGIIIKFRSISRELLKAMAPDKFTLEGMNFEFVRGKNKKITGFKLSAGRAAGIEFVKR